MAKHRFIHLTARQQFGVYKKGDHIEDHAEVERILSGEHRVHVIRLAADNSEEDVAEIEAAEKEAAERAAAREAAAKAAPPALPAPKADALAEAK